MRPEAVGYGAGSADTPTPNVLRLIVGQALDDSPTIRERVAIMETNIDDMNPQVYDYVMRALFDAGARDVFLTPVYMKKNRPGTMLSVICDEADVPAHADIILRETTSIGVRIRIEERITANRTFETVLTEFGPVRLKVSEVGGAPVSVTPEYEDCARIAGTLGVPLKSVIESARAAYRLQTEKKEQ
jgi:uncharacterized protein (DUF111 family)